MDAQAGLDLANGSVQNISGYVQVLVAILKKTAHILTKLALFLENGQSLSEQCATQFSSTLGILTDGYNSLPSAAQEGVFFMSCFAGLLGFVFTMPRIAGLIFGTDPYLDSIPFPSALYNPDEDEQSESFIDADVKPQLKQDASSSTLKCFEPHTGALLGHVPQDTSESVDEKVDLARKAQVSWATTTFAERCRVLRVLRDYILEHQTSICGLSRKDTGKTMLDASLGEVLTTLDKIRWLLMDGEATLKPSRRSVGPMSSHKIAEVIYEPLGVIGAIAPWNYPVHNFLNPVLAALFSGNGIIVKPSEYTAYSSLYVARLVRRALALCKHDPELVQLAVGGADVGKAIASTSIDKLFFTGSTKIGRQVAVTAAERLLPVVLELGGKDPFIVCDDANVEHAASLCLRGVFQNAGQNCIGVERVFLHEAVKDKFMNQVLAVVQQMRLGIDVGAMTMGDRQIDSVLKVLDEAKADGAKVMYGGKRGDVNGKGSYLEPTVIVGVTPEMAIAQEELFAPVMTIFTWKTESELLEKANMCRFGLGSSVFSVNRERAARIVQGLKVGMANINDFGINYLCQSMPFGGVKESGSDRFAGIEGLRGCCLAKSTTRDRYPLVKTVLPRNLKYPVTKNAFSMTSEINKLVYMPGFLSKVDGFRNTMISLCTKEWMPRETKADAEVFA